jgi:glycosyltransferase involved in cell wall biosynthesis
MDNFQSFVDNLQMEINTKSQSDASPKKLKLLFVSTHIFQPTGYAKVTHGILAELAKIPWLTVTHYAIQSLSKDISKRTYHPSINVINAASLEKDPLKSGGFGIQELPECIVKEKPNIILIYNDILVINKYVDVISKLPGDFKIWTYLDQVYPNYQKSSIDMLNMHIDRIFCFSNAWKNALLSQGITRPVDVMTHAFCSDLFIPMSRTLARQGTNIPDDSFIFLNMNRNQPRKRHDILIMAFVDLIIRHPLKQIYLMCVCDNGDTGGYNIFDIFARELTLRKVSIDHFSDRLMLTSNAMCYSDAEVNMFYNMSNCGVSCADGEGFGLCAFEQMGVGIPQVLSNIIGHAEYCNEKNGILVDPKIRAYIPNCISPIGGEVSIVDYRDFSKAMEAFILDDTLCKELGANARSTVMAYTWESSMRIFVSRLQAEFDMNN